jgi:hypothetical protein
MENTQPQLTLADLASLKQIIDAACTRGTFKAAEMKSVGDIYDKLSMFLDSAVAQQKTQETEQAQPQGDQNA